MKKETKVKIAIYGSNLLIPSAASFIHNVALGIPILKRISNSANPYGAVFYGALDLVGGLSKKIKNSRFTKLSKLVGAGYYGTSAVIDLFSIAGGDSQSLANFIFDASMVYQLGKETAENYSGQEILDEFKGITDTAKGLIGKLKESKKKKELSDDVNQEDESSENRTFRTFDSSSDNILRRGS
jgi:hypothetical protein